MKSNEHYKGFTIPDRVNKDVGMSCENSFCSRIVCDGCINYPSNTRRTIRHDYITETNIDEIISEGIERIFDGD